MKNPNGLDPPRWKDAASVDSADSADSTVEAEIGAAARLVLDSPPPDELRLAQLARRAARQLQPRPRSSHLPGQRTWLRTAAVIGASLLVGGAAAAVSGKLIQNFKKARAERAAAATIASPETASRSSRRGGRTSTQGPSQGSFSVGPEGAGIPPVGDAPGGETTAGTGPARRRVALLERARQRPVERAAPNDEARVVSEERRGAPSRVAPASAAPPSSSGSAPLLSPPVEPPPLLLQRTRSFTTPAGTQTGRPASASSSRSAPPPPRPTISEAALVARALGHLRHDGDPLSALDDLDEHARQYPSGPLRREASLTRAETLLALDRGADALAVLDGIRLEPTATDRRVRLARAELRAASGRRGEAIADFDSVVEQGGDPALVSRALYGRAVCRFSGGDLGGARADLRDYLRRFPEGDHRADVEKMLRRLGG